MSTQTIPPDDWDPDPDWPIKAVPQRWVEALFGTMAACYGARFADLWRGTRMAEVKRFWGIELAKLSREQLKAGHENLSCLAKPPTAPEFLDLCRRARIEQATAAAQRLEMSQRADSATVEANLARVREMQRPLTDQRNASVEWAYRLFLRVAASPDKSPAPGSLRFASEAIASPAGRHAIDACTDPELKAKYQTIRKSIVDTYHARGEAPGGSL